MKNNNFYKIKCAKCDAEWQEKESYTSCPKCHSPLVIDYDLKFIKDRLDFYSLKNLPPKTLKYLNFLPIKEFNQTVSLYEGGTPLHRLSDINKSLKNKNLYLKNEGRNPTGSFKDRGSLVEITKAKELGAKKIVIASTGNMGASVSAYAAKAQIPLLVFVPEGASGTKLAQILSYGAHIIQVRGTYDEAAALAEKVAKHFNYFLCGDFVFRCEGYKTESFEIIEQLGWQVPDWVIVPVGNATNISGIWKGFWEFYQLGLITKIPKMVAVQPSGCNPLVQTWKRKSQKQVSVDKPETIASAVTVCSPIDGLKALRGLKQSHGLAIDVTDEEILEAQKQLSSQESIYCEPSSCLPLAAYHKLAAKKIIKKNDKVVLIATSTGLKDPKTSLMAFAEPPSIEPDLQEVKRILRSDILKIRSFGIKQKDKFFTNKEIDKNKIEKTILKEFNIRINSFYKKIVLKKLKEFRLKGKKIAKADLQYILEDVFKSSTLYKQRLKVKDFKLTVLKNKKPEAWVLVDFKTKQYEASAQGVGPVDAIINALQKITKAHGETNFKLTDYKVVINTAGTDAVVYVTITLVDDKNNKVIENGTSPDIIVASIEAFVDAYNALYIKRNGEKWQKK